MPGDTVPTRPHRRAVATKRAVLAVLTAVLTVFCVPTSPASAAQQPTNRVRIDLVELVPRVVDASATSITISGKVTNTGDRKLERLEVRLQRGEVLDSEQELREALAEPQRTSAVNRPVVSGTFEEVVPDLAPGVTASFRLTVGVGADRGAMRLDKPGIYPVAVNINGVPDFGSTERVGALSTMLPVLAVPGGPVVVPPPNPSRLGLLWPLVDAQPRLVRERSGIVPAVLSDDELTTSLASGGRLFNLVDSIRTATAANSTLLRSVCFVIDPDLFNTVDTMTKGYQVRDASGGVVDGTGGAIAEFWLSRARELLRGQCVIALPEADADLVALSRADTVDLQAKAVSVGERPEFQTLLGVKPLPGVVWPDGGTLDQSTLADLSGARRTTVLADANRIVRAQGEAPYALGGGGSPRAMPYDHLIATSLAPRAVDPTGVKTSSVQNGLATLVFRSGLQATDGAPVLVAPPRRWTVERDELDVFLDTVQRLQAQGFMQPLSLPSLLEGTTLGAAEGLEYTAQDSAAEIPADITADVARVNDVHRSLIKSVFT
nr:hypothetical protein [Actinomycetota bacterium]